MKNTPTLITERLILRQFTLEDLHDLHTLLVDESVNTFLPWFVSQSLEQSLQFLNKRFLSTYTRNIGWRYAVCLKATQSVIGYINLGSEPSYDFGYAILSQYQNKGYITEGAGAILDLIQESQVPFITATHDIHNPASGAVMKKLGMVYQYSYTEFWEPKGYDVTFRLYQRNFKEHAPVFMDYWNRYERHEIEDY